MGCPGAAGAVAGGGRELGDGGPATKARLDVPGTVAVDRAGNVYITDQDNFRIRKVDTRGTITTISGTGEKGFSADQGPATKARLGGLQVVPTQRVRR